MKIPPLAPDMTNPERCISVHWSLPVQCVLPCTHRANWHEGWHPETGNRLRYRRTVGVTKELRDGAWVDLGIPGPGHRSREELAAEVDRLRAASSAGDLFADIGAITRWLDESNPVGPHEDSMRVMKLAEECGEAVAAYIGMVGQNPRKGVTHSLDDLLNELADVAVTALCAMQHFTQDTDVTEGVFAAKVERIISRSGIRAVVATGGN
jgi:NTP pyrophosphatase (non-canonical NTP hydrolase)